MRNPKRIRPLCDRLADAWEKHPDLRLGQLIVDSMNGKDPFYTEDEDLIRMLERFVRESTEKKGGKEDG